LGERLNGIQKVASSILVGSTNLKSIKPAELGRVLPVLLFSAAMDSFGSSYRAEIAKPGPKLARLDGFNADQDLSI
jgi:hypothetical protein